MPSRSWYVLVNYVLLYDVNRRCLVTGFQIAERTIVIPGLFVIITLEITTPLDVYSRSCCERRATPVQLQARLFNFWAVTSQSILPYPGIFEHPPRSSKPPHIHSHSVFTVKG